MLLISKTVDNLNRSGMVKKISSVVYHAALSDNNADSEVTLRYYS